MRIEYAIIFSILSLILTACMIIARHSRKKIGGAVSFLVCSLLPPVLGNLIVICSSSEIISTVGYYIYFLGMDVVMYALIRFAFKYCFIEWPNIYLRIFVYLLLTADVIQYALNPLFGQAFVTEEIIVDSEVYYSFVPKAGQMYHRFIDYGIFFVVLAIFFVKMIRSVKIYTERYSVIFFAMVCGGMWETFYIFSRTPIDRSMIGFVIFGILVFYFSIYFRPMRLLDSMLARLASEEEEEIFFLDTNDICIWANDKGCEQMGIEGEDYSTVTGRLSELITELGGQREEWTAEKVIENERETRFYTVEKRLMKLDGKNVAGAFLKICDRTEEKLRLKKEIYNATHDSMTGLFTREHLFKCIASTLSGSSEKYTIVYLNVNDFKIVNDVFGNAFGDLVLCNIADRIRSVMTDKCLYGRLVGDTFGLCIPDTVFDAEKLEGALTRLRVQDGSVNREIIMHMGVYSVSDNSMEVSLMFDRARMAFVTVKNDYQTFVAYYDKAMREQALWEQHISIQVKDAIAKRQIIPYLQPIVDSNGKPVGAEALVRWIHPEDGFMSPASFIPVFEKNGLIAEIDRYMWRQACEILGRWKREGSELFISVNISPKDFYFMDVISEIKGLVSEYEIESSKLRIEITESMMMEDAINRIAILNEFRDSGFIVEMDDFGSGYSSLNMLKDMPVDIIKIDMGFLNRSDNDDRALKILHNIMNMTDDLGIISLTEGVETKEQYRLLSDMGCRLFQGYHFAKPMPVQNFEHWIAG